MKNYPLLAGSNNNYLIAICEQMIDDMITVKPKSMLGSVPADNKPSSKYNEKQNDETIRNKSAACKKNN